ncbi:MAG: pyridoxamine 5'-phosphate oxidase family protein [Fibrobacter sp.]|nr:pyridoxamine 5'-phosphate oxidase family protein [Fibrobacter sp.]
MRRKDREITEISEIKNIVNMCKTCHLGMIDNGMPYVIPLSFGYEMNGHVLTLYFHSAMDGRKIGILKKNNQVCFEMSSEGEPVFARKTPCNSGYYYSSVIGFGKVEFITEPQSKCTALMSIVSHQAGFTPTITLEQASNVCVYKIVSSNFTAKQKQKQKPQT